jgi:prepilin-type N-terminal cleavage/methylation domain-containing protein
MTTKPETAAGGSQAGFSLVELLVTLLVTVILFYGVLTTLDFNGRVTRVQTNVADMQQSLRIAQQEMVRVIRMAGRGTLPAADAVSAPVPTGIAVSIRNNVPANQFLIAGKTDTAIVEGTDVVTVRGVMSTPVYQIDITNQNDQNSAGDFTLQQVPNPTTGTVIIRAISPKGAPQDLAPLREAFTGPVFVPEALVLGSSLDDTFYIVVEVVSVNASADSISVNFRLSGTPRSNQYRALSRNGTLPAGFHAVAYAGILEEYAYYVRADRAIDADNTSTLTPKLSRARLYPGTGTAYVSDENGHVDVADNIVDLQASLGFDTSFSGRTTDDADDLGNDDQIIETANGANDDWLFNSASDDPTNGAWRTNPPPNLYYLRVSTLARTDRRDSGYQAPLLPANIEDRVFTSASPLNSRSERMYRRRLLQTVIDFRNL